VIFTSSNNSTTWTTTNATACTASGDWSTVGGGISNVAASPYSFIGGGQSNSTTSSGGNWQTILGGSGNSTSLTGATVVGGRNNIASGPYSVAMGFVSTTRSIYGAMSLATGNFSAIGDTQTETFVLSATTTNATATELYTIYNGSVSTNAIPVLPAPSASTSSVYTFRGLVSAKNTATTDVAGWRFEGVIQRTGTLASTTALVGTPKIVLLGATSGAVSAGWANISNVSVTADTTNGGISVNVTGAASTTIRWNCRLDTSELG
jgi:hypothetical protein